MTLSHCAYNTCHNSSNIHTLLLCYITLKILSSQQEVFLCEICMASLRLCGFPPGTVDSFRLPNVRGQLVICSCMHSTLFYAAGE